MSMRDRLLGGWTLVLSCAALFGAASPAQAAQPNPRIINGTPYAIEQAPWQVALAFNRDRYQGGSKARFACGGSLIAANVVLTAAHCVFNTPVANGAFNGPEQYEVYVGRTRLSGGQGQVIPVAAVSYLVQDAAGAVQLENVGGPDVGTQLYSTPEYFWDLAVLSLATPATVGTPIPLAGADERATWGGGTTGLVSGWGSVSQMPPHEVADNLSAVQVPIASDEVCAQNHGVHFSLASQMCAGPLEGGHGVCNGDSGGPLAVPVEQGAALGVRLVGVVSLGGADYCAEPNFIDQYARVADAPIRDAIVRAIQPYVATPLVGSGARPYAAPETTIAHHPRAKTRKRKAKFTFGASEPATFQCSTDNGEWTACTSPFKQRVGKGKHVFGVRAIDSLALVDATAATFGWKVKRKRHGHRHHH